MSSAKLIQVAKNIAEEILAGSVSPLRWGLSNLEGVSANVRAW